MKQFFLFSLLQVTACLCYSFQGLNQDQQSYLLDESNSIARESCPIGGSTNPVCRNCSAFVDCRTNAEINCQDCGMICGGRDPSTGNGFAACYNDLDDGSLNHVCLCKPATGGGFVANGNYSDPYLDLIAYVTCDGGEPSYHNCPDKTVFDGTAGECVDGAACPEGYPYDDYEMPLDCDSYIHCADGSIDYCPNNGEIFDSVKASTPTSPPCSNPEDAACLASATPGGKFVPIGACYVHMSCSEISGGFIADLNCCDRGFEYDMTQFKCVEDTSSCSSDTGLCMQQFIEQYDDCNHCVDTNTIYATRKICSEYFFECVDVNGDVKPKLAQCPSSYPIFDPVLGSCNYKDNVAECP